MTEINSLVTIPILENRTEEEQNKIENEKDHRHFGYVYCTVDKLNGMVYIGQHKGKVFDPGYHGSGKEIKRILLERPEDLKTYLIDWAYNIKELNALELEYIVSYGIGAFGYNKQVAGSYEMSEEDVKRKSQRIKESIKNHHFYTDGNSTIFIDPDVTPVPKGFHHGVTRRQGFVSKARGTKWYNNGKIMKMCTPGTEPEGFVEGQLPDMNHDHVSGKKWYHDKNGTTALFIPGTEPEGWKLGIKKDPSDHIRTAYTNGTRDIFIKDGEQVPEGFHKGLHVKSTLGTKWYTKDGQSKLFREGDIIPEGWVPGAAYKTNNNRRWYNDGKTNKMFIPGTEPDGWKLGKIMKNAGKKLLWYHTPDGKNHRIYEGKEVPEDWIPGRIRK